MNEPAASPDDRPTEAALPTLDDVESVRELIAPHIWRTPTVEVQASPPLYLKMECWQRTGSFKIRGALARTLSLSPQELRLGVATASAGNHGLGVAEAARIAGVPCHVFVPTTVSPAKLNALKEYDVRIHVHGRDYDECEEVARRWATQSGVGFIHAFDDPQVIAGQGTLALELLEQVEELHTVYVPVGGGGLIAGVARVLKSLRPDIRVIGVQPEASPAMVRSLEARRVVEAPFTTTIADGLAGRFVSPRTLRACQLWVDEFVLVSESQIRRALRWLADTVHTIAEGSAVVGIAAALSQSDSSPAATIVTGRNIDTDLFLNSLTSGGERWANPKPR